jgi:hypothetical protein
MRSNLSDSNTRLDHMAHTKRRSRFTRGANWAFWLSQKAYGSAPSRRIKEVARLIHLTTHYLRLRTPGVASDRK